MRHRRSISRGFRAKKGNLKSFSSRKYRKQPTRRKKYYRDSRGGIRL
jgi:hypothetical protein